LLIIFFFFLFPFPSPLILILFPLTLFSLRFPLGLGETVKKILRSKNQLLESRISIIVLNRSFSTFSISSKTSLFVNRINFNHIMHYGFFPFYFCLFPFSFFLSPFPFFLFTFSFLLFTFSFLLSPFYFTLNLYHSTSYFYTFSLHDDLPILESRISIIVLNISFSTFSISSKTSLFVNRINFNHIMHYGSYIVIFLLFSQILWKCQKLNRAHNSF